MTKKKLLQYTAIIELVSLLLSFALMYGLTDYGIGRCLLVSLLVSTISGVVVYIRLSHSFGLDLRPWSEERAE